MMFRVSSSPGSLIYRLGARLIKSIIMSMQRERERERGREGERERKGGREKERGRERVRESA